MQLINTYEAKTNLSKILDWVLMGEEIVIGKAGKPIVRMVPYKGEEKPRKFGQMKGKVWVSDDFNDESPEINEMFYGKV